MEILIYSPPPNLLPSAWRGLRRRWTRWGGAMLRCWSRCAWSSAACATPRAAAVIATAVIAACCQRRLLPCRLPAANASLSLSLSPPLLSLPPLQSLRHRLRHPTRRRCDRHRCDRRLLPAPLAASAGFATCLPAANRMLLPPTPPCFSAPLQSLRHRLRHPPRRRCDRHRFDRHLL